MINSLNFSGFPDSRLTPSGSQSKFEEIGSNSPVFFVFRRFRLLQPALLSHWHQLNICTYMHLSACQYYRSITKKSDYYRKSITKL